MKITISIFPDNRLKGHLLKMRANIAWSGGMKRITLPDHYSPAREDYDFNNKSLVRKASQRSQDAWKLINQLREYVPMLDPDDAYQGIVLIQNFITSVEKGANIKINSITGYVKEFIDLKKSTYSYNSIRAYETLIRNILYYCHDKNTTDIIHLDRTSQIVWFSRYVDFLLNDEIFEAGPELRSRVERILGRKFREKKTRYQNVSVKNEFKLLQSVFGVFNGSGLRVELDMFHSNLRAPQKEAPYYEIEQLVDIIKHSEEGVKEKVLDIAIFQSFTGARYSELYQVEDSNITVRMIGEDRTISIWNYVQGKGGINKSVPLNDICLRIIQKWKDKKFTSPTLLIREPRTVKKENYPDCLLPMVTEQVFNRELKDVLKDIPSFQKVIKQVYYYGSDRVEESIPQYSLFSSHSARHTFSHMLYINGLTMGEVGELINSQATSEKHYKHIQKDVLHLKALDVLNKVG